MSHYSSIESRQNRKRRIAENAFKLIYESDAERELKKEVLNTVLEQISVCEELHCPVEIETIINWIRNKTVAEIERESRKLKFAS